MPSKSKAVTDLESRVDSMESMLSGIAGKLGVGVDQPAQESPKQTANEQPAPAVQSKPKPGGMAKDTAPSAQVADDGKGMWLYIPFGEGEATESGKRIKWGGSYGVTGVKGPNGNPIQVTATAMSKPR